MTVTFDGETTSIELKDGNMEDLNSTYDLQGRKVNAQPNSQLKNGVYISGGKKYFFKK